MGFTRAFQTKCVSEYNGIICMSYDDWFLAPEGAQERLISVCLFICLVSLKSLFRCHLGLS